MKGNRIHMKRIAMPEKWPLMRKEKEFVMRSKGPHKLGESLPLMIIIRDMLKFANSAREAKKIIKDGQISVNNRVIRDEKFGAGLFDKISIPKMDKYFELIVKNKKLTLREIKKEEAMIKTCKVIGKKIVNKNQLQINLYGGLNVTSKDEKKVKVGDSVILNLKDFSVEKILNLNTGSRCIIIGGKNSGKSGKIVDIEKGKKKSVTIEDEKGKTKVFKKNILVIE
jgi:small subunit ribosomal protein S4e